MPASSAAETFWSSRPVLMSVAEVAPLIGRTEATVASLANRHEIGAYKVAGRWLIAGIDMRGFAASDARAAKSDLALVIEPALEFTGDVGGTFGHLPELLSSRTVAKILRIGSAKLTEPGLAVDRQGLVKRGALTEFLRSVSKAGTTRLRLRDGPRCRCACRATRQRTGYVCRARHDGHTGS